MSKPHIKKIAGTAIWRCELPLDGPFSVVGYGASWHAAYLDAQLRLQRIGSGLGVVQNMEMKV